MRMTATKANTNTFGNLVETKGEEKDSETQERHGKDNGNTKDSFKYGTRRDRTSSPYLVKQRQKPRNATDTTQRTENSDKGK